MTPQTLLITLALLVLKPVAWADESFPGGQVGKSSDNAVSLMATNNSGAFHHNPVSLGDNNRYSQPNFSRISNSVQRKEAFYNFLLPMIHRANKEIMLERQRLLSMGDILLAFRNLSPAQLEEVDRLERRYGIRAEGSRIAVRIGTLLARVDVVPASLVVAQAAKESGWGTSRFATEGNNFFGIWCFNRGCGLKPLQRESGLMHEVATFDSVEQGVQYYVRTINTHHAYRELRSIRFEARRQQLSPVGEQLANGLVRYSERGTKYVKEIQSMIRYNKLHRFTRIYQV